MIPYYKWTLRLWFVDVNWKSKGIWKLNFSLISRKSFVGKRELKFFYHK